MVPIKFDNIEISLKSEDSFLLQWKIKAYRLFEFLENRIESIEKDLLDNDILSSTKNRLTQLKNAEEFNLIEIKRILKPLVEEDDVMGPFEGDPLPDTQHLQSYYKNIFRDWVWDTEENKLSADMLIKSLEAIDQTKIKKTVVLGAGSGRLAFDLQNKLNFKDLTLLDINPFLLLIAKNVMKNEKLSLFDIPETPEDLSKAFTKKEFAVDYKVNSENINLMLGDGVNLPFESKSVDLFIAPWFIDIIEEDFRDYIKRINHCLNLSGHFLLFGPLGFNSNIPKKAYFKEEVLEIFKENGFELVSEQMQTIPYLKNPSSGNSRSERVYCLICKKVSEVNKPKEFIYYPNWIVDNSLPIPRDVLIEETQLKSKLHFDILSIVDGQKSINDISKLMSGAYQMTEEQAKESLQMYLMGLVKHF